MKFIKLLIAIILASTVSSCIVDLRFGSVDGNGNVVTEDRVVNSSFDQVKGSAGIDVYLIEGTEEKIVVEADENLLEVIETKVNNGKLTIGTVDGKNIGKSKSKKVYVTFKQLEGISSSSGADVIANNII